MVVHVCSLLTRAADSAALLMPRAPVTVPQVPSEDWGGGYGGGDAVDSGGEIPCRRMRSGSYIKAMGDDDSADSDTSPKASPKSTLIAQREAFKRSASMDQR